MIGWRKRIPDAPPEASDRQRDKRRHGRVRTDEFETRLGWIADASGSGLRIRSRHEPAVKAGDSLPLEIRGPDSAAVVPIRVAWVRKVGRRGFEVGVEFVQLDAAAKGVLASIFRTSLTTTLDPE